MAIYAEPERDDGVAGAMRWAVAGARRWIGAAAGAALLAGCSQPAELAVDRAWVRLPAVSGQPGVGYFTLHGGAEPATLIAVSSAWAIRADMHETMAGHHGMMTMKPLDRVAVPAGGEVAFAPGGRHIMVHGINPAVKAGDTMTFTFTFSDGRRIRRIARVVAPGGGG